MEQNHQGRSLAYFIWVYVAIFSFIAIAVMISEKTFIH